MVEFPDLPNKISHKELNSLLTSASKEKQRQEPEAPVCSFEKEEFNDLLNKWGEVSKDLLRLLQEKDKSILEGMNPQKAMALGILKTHLTMALQAKHASEGEPK